MSAAAGGAACGAGVAGDGLDAALHQLGVFRLYQRYVVLLLCVPSLLASIYSLNYVFVADKTDYRCVIPECEGTSPKYNNSAVSALLPEDKCVRYEPRPTAGTDPCSPHYYNLTSTIKCDHFVYENDYSIVSDFDLGCREWQRTLVGSLHQAGVPVALVLTGYTSDTFGRRRAFCVFAFCVGALGLVKSLSVNYAMFAAMEFLEAALGYGFNSCAYVMLLEIAHPSVRGAVASLSGVAYGAGGCGLALAAWRLPRWRPLLRLLYAPALLLPLYRLALDDSMRWLHSKGRVDDLDRVMRKAARWNKVTLDEELMKSIRQPSPGQSRSTGSSWRLVLRSRTYLSRFVICGWVWIATAFVYYGLTINAVSLAGDKYVNYALGMAMEIVASLLLMMSLERLGRKWTVFVTTLLCGTACVVPFFIKHAVVSTTLYFAGKLSVTMSFNAAYVLSGELFPTALRGSSLAALSLVGRVGSVLAPQTPLLSMNVQAVVYGAVTLTSALGVLLLPETLGAALPHSLPASRRHSRPGPA